MFYREVTTEKSEYPQYIIDIPEKLEKDEIKEAIKQIKDMPTAKNFFELDAQNQVLDELEKKLTQIEKEKEEDYLKIDDFEFEHDEDIPYWQRH